MFSWLIAFCCEIMDKFRIGPDGRTAYEKITEHKCKQQMIGFAEAVDFMFENDKQHMHKADSRVMKGVLLGYVWRSTEYIVGTKDGVFRCRTVRRRAEEVAYDPECVDFLKISYNEYVLKGAKTAPLIAFPRSGVPEDPAPIPMRGREFVPRRVYLRNADYEKHGHTQGCKGCIWVQNQIGTRYPHSDACRARLEKAMDDR